MKKGLRSCLCWSLLFFVLLLEASIGEAESIPGFKNIPLNPAFIESASESLNSTRSNSSSGRALGHRPSPIDLSHLRYTDSSVLTRGSGERKALPAKYDLRDYGYVTSVKDQGSYNVCWAFSALGAIESSYLRKTGTTLDLSEGHLGYYAYKDGVGFTYRTADPLQNGGFDNIAVAALARYVGPVLDSYLPLGNTPVGGASSYPNRLHLQDVFFLNLQMFALEDQQPSNDIRKELIYTYGAISLAYHASQESNYNPTTFAWNNVGIPISKSDHAVLAVGWDDDYSRFNFNESVRPSANGAWLIKNSWGTKWGDGGYFWLSYEDSSLSDGAVYLAEETNNYDKVYSHDELGWCTIIGPTDDSLYSAYSANVFTAGNNETLQAVSFYTTSNAASYEIRVYTGVTGSQSPVAGTLVLTQNGSEALCGYHTIKLNTPVPLPNGAKFSVAVKMTTPGYNGPLAAESKIMGYSDKAVSYVGESFFSLDGSEWGDAAQISANACIKAFTTKGSSSGDDPGDPGDTTGSVLSDRSGDWLISAERIRNDLYEVVFKSYVDVTNGALSGVSAITNGLTGVTVKIDGIKRADTPRNSTWNTITITGSASDLRTVSLRGLSFTQGSKSYTQEFGVAIPYKNTNTPSSGGGGGGGCTAIGGWFLLVASGFLACHRRR